MEARRLGVSLRRVGHRPSGLIAACHRHGQNLTVLRGAVARRRRTTAHTAIHRSDRERGSRSEKCHEGPACDARANRHAKISIKCPGKVKLDDFFGASANRLDSPLGTIGAPADLGAGLSGPVIVWRPIQTWEEPPLRRFGTELKRIRHAIRETGGEVACLAGISESYYYNLGKGRRRPRLSSRQDLVTDFRELGLERDATELLKEFPRRHHRPEAGLPLSPPSANTKLTLRLSPAWNQAPQIRCGMELALYARVSTTSQQLGPQLDALRDTLRRALIETLWNTSTGR